MHTIAVWVAKGGTGKTTLAGNLGYHLAQRHRVLLVDCDQQSNLSSWFLTSPAQHELADVLQGKTPLKTAAVQVRERLWLLPSFIDGGLVEYGERVLPGKPFAFAELVEDAKGYDFVILDMGPGTSTLERTAISAVKEIIGVAQPEYFSVDGLETFKAEIARIRKDRRSGVEARRLVVNRVNRSYALHLAYAKELEGLGYLVYRIGQSTAIADCVPRHKALAEYDRRNRNLREIERLAKAVGR